ncbi:MAG: invasion associated locus B family protein [Pseudomonadota bacterium]
MKKIVTGNRITMQKMLSKIAVAVGVAVMAASSGHAQEANNNNLPSGEWFKVCSKSADNDICNVQNIRTAQTGQLLTAVNLIQITGKTNRSLFQIAVPTGRVIPAGIALQIDGGEARRINYAICLPDRCIAEAPLTDELVAALKRGGSMRLTSVNFQQQQNPIDVTLNGFTAAFDGEPLQQSELQTRQQELQAEIEKRREEFQQKLREEQEKAKQAN